MRTRAIILGSAVTAALVVANFLPSVGSAVAERTQIPDHVYEEAERQLDVFVTWARNDAAVPDMGNPETPAS
ncbi:hypothetical protein [Maricaulis maris]|uniref:hypothetical protein n=1 Tax=Maricaulis maris TaxID=74318 RepID=UPI003B8D5A0A